MVCGGQKLVHLSTFAHNWGQIFLLPGRAPNEVAIKTYGGSLPGLWWGMVPETRRSSYARSMRWEITEQDYQQVNFSYALPNDNKSIYLSLSFRFTSEYLHYRQVAKWADMFLQHAEWRREISKVVYGALDPYKWVRSCSLAYSNSFLVSIRKRNLQKCCICHIVEHICAKNKTSLWANPWKENQVRDNIAEHWYELKYCTLRQK